MSFKDASVMPVLAVDDLDRAKRSTATSWASSRGRTVARQRRGRDRLERLPVPLQDRVQARREHGRLVPGDDVMSRCASFAAAA